MANLEKFVVQCKLADMNEVLKTCYLAFFYLKTENVKEFDLKTVGKWMDLLHLPIPNTSRLAKNLATSNNVIKGSNNEYFRLHRNFIVAKEIDFPDVKATSQIVEDKGSLLPEILYVDTPGYIKSVSKQINASFEWNIFDGCAVLMRRLEEILLILAYEHLNISSNIKDANGNYFMLEAIVKNAIVNNQLNLSRNGKKTIETIRELGNYSAHKITYTCKREYIEERTGEYRALIDELLHKAGIRI